MTTTATPTLTPAATPAKKRTTKHAHLLPYPDFPLSPHPATNRWYKKINGRRVYFGPLDDWQAALDKYTREAPFLHAGKAVPLTAGTGGITVRDCVNVYLTAKKQQIDSDELSRRSFRDYFATCERIINHFTRDRLAEDLGPDDFRKLRLKLAKTRGPVALGNEVQRTRSVFTFCFDDGLLDKPVRFGKMFKKPSAKNVRKARHEAPARFFEAQEIRDLLAIAGVPMRAMILLAVNAGLGNTDLADLPIDAIDLDAGIMHYPRPKTEVERRATLWPETVDALRHAIAARPKPMNKTDSRQVFITRFGHRWTRLNGNDTPVDSIGLEFHKLLTPPDPPKKKFGLGIKKKGVSFYALRHVFETISGETLDQPAVNRIMGHTDSTMADKYREWRKDQREDDRLRKVTDHVRAWLFDALE